MERAAKLTQQMLAYSGKGKFQIRTIDLGAVVREHVSLFITSLPKNVKLDMRIPQIPVCVEGDPGQIEQIIMNLIINSGEAIGDRQGCISVNLAAAAFGRDELMHYGKLTNAKLMEGNYVLIEVSDNGCGISEETMHKIFDPFFTTKFTGRGLGLSAVLGIIRGHKGGITVENREGGGTIFRVILPVVTPPTHSEEPSAPQLQTQATTMAATILVIDDELDVATMASDILETQKYNVVVKLNPIEALELYKQRQSEIGVVLLDMTMPEMSGKEVADCLHQINRDVKIIITSGYSKEEVTNKLGAAKVSGFIQKPYRLQSLLKIVDSVLH